MYRFHSTLLLLLVSAVAFGQKDSTRAVLREQYFPTGVRFGTDVLALVRSQVRDNFSGWEVSADTDINRYLIQVDYGSWGLNYNQYSETALRDTLTYSNRGTYWRAGVDVNFLTRDPDRNMFFIGLRYGRSNFDERFYVEDQSIYWGSKTETYQNNNVGARWFELTTGLKVRMWKFIWMGYTARFKFGLKTGATPDLVPHDVPGYGLTNKETTYGFNYQLFFRIPVRPLPPLPPAKKKKKG